MDSGTDECLSEVDGRRVSEINIETKKQMNSRRVTP
jgi:hypothetical protein